MINVIAAEPRHAYMVEPRACFSGTSVELVASAIDRSPSFTIINSDGEPIAIFGMVHIHARTWELWGHISDEVIKVPVSSARASLKVIESFAEVHDLKRMQMVVKKDYLVGYKFSLFLGFIPEGVMREYGPEGADYYMMGRIF
jgi:hypothetical protein